MLLAFVCLGTTPAPSPPSPVMHVTIVMMENRDGERVIGNADAPYTNQTLVPQGLLLTNSHAVTHPSEPNYLALFAGSTHGVTNDRCPLSYDSRNVASELIAAGKTFTGYSESMPSDGYEGCWTARYARKHNPWSNFSNVPPSSNLVYRNQTASTASLTWIVPNMCHDMHDCSTRTGDAWLAGHLPAIVAWNAKNHGLLIVTWDEAEPDRDGTNRIPTILVGPMLTPGSKSAQYVDHYAVLRTIEAIFGLACIDKECSAMPIRSARLLGLP